MGFLRELWFRGFVASFAFRIAFCEADSKLAIGSRVRLLRWSQGGLCGRGCIDRRVLSVSTPIVIMATFTVSTGR